MNESSTHSTYFRVRPTRARIQCLPEVSAMRAVRLLKPALTWDYTACSDKSGRSPRPMTLPAEAVGAVTRSSLICMEDVAP